MMVAACGLVDQSVAGSLGSGSVSALSYGTKFATVLVAVGGTGLATAVLPQFSRLVSEGNWEALRRAFRKHVTVAMLVMAPVTLLLMWWSMDAVRVTYEYGAFGPRETGLVSQIQRFSLLQVPFVVILMVTQRLATALAATRLILQAGVAAVFTNIAGDLLLPRWFGVGGVALASASGQCVFLAVLIVLLWRHKPQLFRRQDFQSKL
jgi:putative peptidoglycan lipid II flippase